MTAITHSRSLVSGDVLVMGVSPQQDGAPVHGARGKLGRWLSDSIDRLSFDAGKDSVATIPAPSWSNYQTVVLVGVSPSQPTTSATRYAAGTACRSLSGDVVIHIPTKNTADATAIAEGALLGATKTMNRKSGDGAPPVASITVVSRHVPNFAAIRPGVDAVALVRDLVTEAPNVLSPDELARRVVELSKGQNLAVEVLDEKALERGGYGGILGIGAGSSRPPRL
ncbi:MAG: leucyl aminopeptidase, partial [Microbacteriaceae bacterium]|nr:leucyl aminopeptidase [Microbacteriaceae bacterium]